MELRGNGLTGSSASVASMNHDPCYHELHNLSNIIIVLVFSEMASFIRMILQREENKGVELTVCLRNGSGAAECEGPVAVAWIRFKSPDTETTTNSKPAS